MTTEKMLAYIESFIHKDMGYGEEYRKTLEGICADLKNKGYDTHWVDGDFKTVLDAVYLNVRIPKESKIKKGVKAKVREIRLKLLKKRKGVAERQ